MTEQIIDNETERAYAEISARLTAAGIAVDQARDNLQRFIHVHTIPTHFVRAEVERLRVEVENAERELQKLLPMYAEAKSKINGWN
jgi:hypothetical protein